MIRTTTRIATRTCRATLRGTSSHGRASGVRPLTGHRRLDRDDSSPGRGPARRPLSFNAVSGPRRLDTRSPRGGDRRDRRRRRPRRSRDPLAPGDAGRLESSRFSSSSSCSKTRMPVCGPGPANVQRERGRAEVRHHRMPWFSRCALRRSARRTQRSRPGPPTRRRRGRCVAWSEDAPRAPRRQSAGERRHRRRGENSGCCARPRRRSGAPPLARAMRSSSFVTPMRARSWSLAATARSARR